MKKVAASGARLLLISAAVAKLLALFGQVALGWFLQEGDWGVYALVLSIASLTQIIRDGGVGYVIIQRGVEGYKLVSGPAFWISASFNAAAVVVLLVIAPAAAHVYDNPLILPMLSVVALSVAAGTATPVLKAGLQVSFKFGAVAAMGLLARIVTWGAAITMAALGAGAMSFVWSAFAGGLCEAATAWFLSKDSPWRRAANVSSWPALLGEGSWVLFGSFSAALAARIDYLVLGFFVGVQTLGLYVFAYEMTAQLPVLVWGSLLAVLLPILRHLVCDKLRFAKAAQQFVLPALLAVGIPSFFFAAVCEPLEQLLWGGKWSAAVPMMQMFACAAPIRILLLVPEAMQLATGSYKARALIILTRAAAVGAAATCAGALAPTNMFAAAFLVAAAQSVAALAATAMVLRSYDCRVERLAPPVLASLLLLAITAAGVSAIDGTYLEERLPPLARIGILLPLYAVVIAMMLRVVQPQQTRELVRILPGRIRRGAAIVLRLDD